jgi:hypothetical protein
MLKCRRREETPPPPQSWAAMPRNVKQRHQKGSGRSNQRLLVSDTISLGTSCLIEEITFTSLSGIYLTRTKVLVKLYAQESQNLF